MSSEAQRRAVAKYDAQNTRRYSIKLNVKTDADIIAWLDQQPDGVQTSVKIAIRAMIGKDLGKNWESVGEISKPVLVSVGGKSFYLQIVWNAVNLYSGENGEYIRCLTTLDEAISFAESIV